MLHRLFRITLSSAIVFASAACDSSHDAGSGANKHKSPWSLSKTQDPMTDEEVLTGSATFSSSPFRIEATISCKGSKDLYYDFTTYGDGINDPEAANIKADTSFLNTGDSVMFYNYRIDNEEVKPASSVDIEFTNRLSIGSITKNIRAEAAMGWAPLLTGLTGGVKRGPVAHSKDFSQAKMLRIEIPLVGGNAQLNIDQTDPAVHRVIGACTPKSQSTSASLQAGYLDSNIDIASSSTEELLTHFADMASKTIKNNAYYHSIDIWNGGCEVGESVEYGPNESQNNWDGSWKKGQEVARFYVASMKTISPDNIGSGDAPPPNSPLAVFSTSAATSSGLQEEGAFTLSLDTGSSQNHLLDVWIGTSDSADGKINWTYTGRTENAGFKGRASLLGDRDLLVLNFVKPDKPKAIAIFNELMKRCPYTETSALTRFDDSWKPGGTIYKRIVLRSYGADVHEIVETAKTQSQEPQSPSEATEPDASDDDAATPLTPSSNQPNSGAVRPSAPAKATPSFDCDNAVTSQEKMICASDELSSLDAALHSAYTAYLDSLTADQRIARQGAPLAQRRWLIERDKCADEECLKNSYIARISSLRNQTQTNAALPR